MATNTVQSEGFQKFWESYPRKVAKKRAESIWNRLKPDETLIKRIIADVVVRSSSEDWTKGGGQFIPHPATYLNGERWEDEVETCVPMTGFSKFGSGTLRLDYETTLTCGPGQS